MGRTSHCAVPCLIATALLACAGANAQAHGPPATKFLDEVDSSPAMRATKLAEMDAWLRRMTGHFRLSSALNSARPGLLVNCVGIGDGPGLQCVSGRGGSTPPGEQANTNMQLFGLDPLALTVARLTVNGRGIAQHAQGKVKGDTLVFPRVNCPVPENMRSEMRMISCQEILKIRALPDGMNLQFTTERIIRTVGRETSSSSTTWMKRVRE